MLTLINSPAPGEKDVALPKLKVAQIIPEFTRAIRGNSGYAAGWEIFQEHKLSKCSTDGKFDVDLLKLGNFAESVLWSHPVPRHEPMQLTRYRLTGRCSSAQLLRALPPDPRLPVGLLATLLETQEVSQDGLLENQGAPNLLIIQDPRSPTRLMQVGISAQIDKRIWKEVRFWQVGASTFDPTEMSEDWFPGVRILVAR